LALTSRADASDEGGQRRMMLTSALDVLAVRARRRHNPPSIVQGVWMVRTIARIGNSIALIFDTALRELTGLQEGDAVDVTVREDGCVVITPLRRTISVADAASAARNFIERNASLFERLSK
jgi:antitoxin component of MazEF toxin-antitoxin module